MSTITIFNVARVLAGFCILISIARIIIVFVAHKNIPKVLRAIHTMIALVFLGVVVSIPILIGYNFKNEELYLLLMFLLTTAAFVACIACSLYVPKLQAIDEAVERRLEYRKLTAKTFAEQNGIEYIPSVEQEDVTNYETNSEEEPTQHITQLLVKYNYVSFLPINDGKDSKPIEWVKEVTSEDFAVPYLGEVLTNTDLFNGITNLEEILEQMISLYSDNIGKDVFISPYDFALKLKGEIKENYQGPAELVITNQTVLNSKVSSTEKLEMKKNCINTFLDVFLTLNFGEVFRKNKALDKKLRDFNAKVIEKGLRRHEVTIKATYNKDVQRIQNLEIK